ncbi:retropepsin-like aspartic protease [Alteromonas sp. 1_MG-2023]|uniref:retropepsin-like aspartic protease family protein n=1 Tax=Alteromonas sp. 1_MG-2023 TaxID=3062669 RepID=UPI0026E36862|nr:retropepsin-like aspartic protease [Alteromonas sp. 1_MG-2023]MDO6477813.1 retropepsin-like aspartic protease [Alteromonas sp. 1_MG-2023]
MKFTALFYLLISVTPVHAAMDEIPLQVTDDGHFSLKAAVNGKEGKFILDTGSTGSVVGLSKLEHFGIKIASSGINGVTAGDEKEGTTQTFPVSIRSMVIENYELTLRNIYANSIGQLGPDIDGIIGHDAIVELHALVDINKGRLLVPEDESDTKDFFQALIRSIPPFLCCKLK